MPGLYAPDGGVNRLPKKWITLVGGVNKELKELYGAAGGASRKIFSAEPAYTIATSTNGHTYTAIAGDGRIYLHFNSSWVGAGITAKVLFPVSPQIKSVTITPNPDANFLKTSQYDDMFYAFRIDPSSAGAYTGSLGYHGLAQAWDVPQTIAADDRYFSSIEFSYGDYAQDNNVKESNVYLTIQVTLTDGTIFNIHG